MLRAITSGLSSAFAERRLVVLLWVLNIGLALVVAVPFWLWGSGALGTSIEAQVLASGWDGAAFADLMEESSAAVVAFALVTAITIAIAAIGSAFVSSGTLAVLIAHARGREEGAVPASRAVMSRFFEGGGRFFWRSLGLTVLTGIAIVIVGGVVFGVTRAATRPLEDSLTEAGAWTRAFVPLVLGGIVLLVWVIVLEFARLALVSSDRKGVWRNWTAGLRFVLSHLVGTVGLWLVFGALVLAAAGGYLAASGVAPSGTGTGVAVLVVLQQLFMLWRTAMRVGLVSGQVALANASGMRGLVVDPVPAFVPPVEDPVDLDLAPNGTSDAAAPQPSVAEVAEVAPVESAAGEKESPAPQLPV